MESSQEQAQNAIDQIKGNEISTDSDIGTTNTDNTDSVEEATKESQEETEVHSDNQTTTDGNSRLNATIKVDKQHKTKENENESAELGEGEIQTSTLPDKQGLNKTTEEPHTRTNGNETTEEPHIETKENETAEEPHIKTNRNETTKISQVGTNGNETTGESRIERGGNETTKISQVGTNGNETTEESQVGTNGNETTEVSQLGTNGNETTEESHIEASGNDIQEESQVKKNVNGTANEPLIEANRTENTDEPPIENKGNETKATQKPSLSNSAVAKNSTITEKTQTQGSSNLKESWKPSKRLNVLVGALSTKILAIELVDPIRNNFIAPLLNTLGVQDTQIDDGADDLGKLEKRLRKDPKLLKEAFDKIVNDTENTDIKGSTDKRDINGIIINLLPQSIEENVFEPLLKYLLINEKHPTSTNLIFILSKLNTTLVQQPDLFKKALKRVSKSLGEKKQLKSRSATTPEGVKERILSPTAVLLSVPELLESVRPIYMQLWHDANSGLKPTQSNNKEKVVMIEKNHIQNTRDLTKNTDPIKLIMKAARKSLEKDGKENVKYIIKVSKNHPKESKNMDLMIPLVPIMSNSIAQPIVGHYVKEILGHGKGIRSKLRPDLNLVLKFKKSIKRDPKVVKKAFLKLAGNH